MREQILKRIKEEGVPVAQLAKEHGCAEQTTYGWLGKGAAAAPSWNEYVKLKRENKALLELVGEMTLKLSESQKKSWFAIRTAADTPSRSPWVCPFPRSITARSYPAKTVH